MPITFRPKRVGQLFWKHILQGLGGSGLRLGWEPKKVGLGWAGLGWAGLGWEAGVTGLVRWLAGLGWGAGLGWAGPRVGWAGWALRNPAFRV